MRNRRTGFTLIELLACLSIAGILGAIAIPAWQTARYATAGAETRASLLSGLMLASHKAALHGVRTTLCPSLDGAACRSGFDWSGGWIGFIDQNGNRERDAGEHLIGRQAALRDSRLISSSGRTRIVFQGNGGNAGSNVTFTLCDRRGAGKAQTLVVSNTGNLRNGVPSDDRIALACAF